MGQYYKPYLRFADGSEECYHANHALFRTKYGIAADEEIGTGVGLSTTRYPEGYFEMFVGLKLLEHSWFGNRFVNGVMERIEGRPAVVAWVGDYGDYDSDFRLYPGYSQSLYRRVWKSGGEPRALPDMPFPKMPGDHRDGFLVNRTKRLFIDLEAYFEKCKAKMWEDWWCVHPLPVLTAIGNGRGGGDYFGHPERRRNEEMAGRWAMDAIEYVHVRPGGRYREVDYGRYIFDPKA